MINRHRFSKRFAKNMLLLAVATGLVISTLMPFTYFKLSYDEKKRVAVAHSGRIAELLSESIKDNPKLWQFNAQKFLQVFSISEFKGVSIVRIYNNEGVPVLTQELSKDPLFAVSGRAVVKYNNRVYGYMEIDEGINEVVYRTTLLFVTFSFLGCLVGFILYRFPTKIVARAEKDILDALDTLNFLSFHDPLTKLPNRVKLVNELGSILKKAEENSSQFAVMFLDLDRFKEVNDSFGHSQGDVLLKAVSDRLTTFLSEGEVLARQGGDEFVIIVPSFSDLQEVREKAKKIIGGMDTNYIIQGKEIFITTSIGISVYPIDGKDIDTLLKHADIAMYFAKDLGKNNFCFYSNHLGSSPDKYTLEGELRKAIEQDNLQVYYQPIIDSRTGIVIGAESLVRWNHPEKGLLQPAQFMQMAEETGLIVPIGEWVLYKACEQNKRWEEAGFSALFTTVNISASQFRERSFEDVILNTFQKTGVSPGNIVLEITESTYMHNEDYFILKLHVLKNLGIKVAIDDFGTGYCSFSYLKQFPVDILKIDKGFIQGATSNRKDRAIVTAMISMARQLEIEIVAEGVETEEQKMFLDQNCCYNLQGYLFSEPVSEERFTKILNSEGEMAV